MFQSGSSSLGISSARVRAWLWLATLVPAAAIGSLAWLLVAHDRARDVEARRSAREQMAEVAVAALQQAFAELDAHLGSPPGSLPNRAPASDDIAILSLDSDGITSRAGVRLPFYPGRHLPEMLPAVVRHADALAFDDPAGAIGALSALLPAADLHLRALALLRLARLYAKTGDVERALTSFDALGALEDVEVHGTPAGLRGRQGRGLLLAAQGRTTELKAAAERLTSDLDSGRWTLTRPQYEFAREQAVAWLGTAPPSPADPLALANAIEVVWASWERNGAPDMATTRAAIWSGDRSVLTVSRAAGAQLRLIAAPPAFVERRWRVSPSAIDGEPGLTLALTDAEGRTVAGNPRVSPDRQSIRASATTRLPWTLYIVDIGTGSSQLSGQARVMLAALGVMFVVVLAGGYAISRGVARELRANALQSDFIAAVSHEFRTPLTTVRYLSELLQHERVSSDERRSEFYQILVRESGRLQRLVESLMNFARLEGGELEYHFASIDPLVFVGDVVEDFRREVTRPDVTISIERADPPLPPIRADREVLARVLWNLLDNAVKYSPGPCAVTVAISRSDGAITIAVKDRGMGIPPEEQRAIFRKFVRGTAAKAASIRGTGIGLAMARAIVRAHGGDITVESTAGTGSTFTVTIPADPAELPSSLDVAASVSSKVRSS